MCWGCLLHPTHLLSSNKDKPNSNLIKLPLAPLWKTPVCPHHCTHERERQFHLKISLLCFYGRSQKITCILIPWVGTTKLDLSKSFFWQNYIYMLCPYLIKSTLCYPTISPDITFVLFSKSIGRGNSFRVTILFTLLSQDSIMASGLYFTTS